MKTDYIEFELILGNGEKCNVKYCDQWSSPIFGHRTIHFEFRDCLSISETGYRSHFTNVAENEKVDPKEVAKQIIESMTGIKFQSGVQQQVLL